LGQLGVVLYCPWRSAVVPLVGWRARAWSDWAGSIMVADQARQAVVVAVAVTSALAALVAGSAVGPADGIQGNKCRSAVVPNPYW